MSDNSIKKIVVVNPYANETQRNKIMDTAAKYNRSAEIYDSVEEALPHLQGAEIIYGPSPKLIANAPDLKWYCSASAGIDHYVKSGVFENRDIILTNSSGSFGLSIAEYMIMMSLWMMKRMPEYQVAIANHQWLQGLEISSLYGSRIVVLGTGNLGKSFAERVRAFHPASLVGVNRSGRFVEFFDEVVDISHFGDVISQVDLLILCLPGTKETEGIISREVLEKMPDTAFIVNTGRGSAIDMDALVDALEAGKIAGAALDVFPNEPLPADSPLWNVKNLLITPHISGQETLPWTRNNNCDMFCEDMENYFEGRPLAHLASVAKGY